MNDTLSTVTVRASVDLTAFVGRHEGFVSKAYRDAGGVLTIGYGFTMLSRAFAGYWRIKFGRGLAMGDTITRAEADAVLALLIAQEYQPPVERRFPRALLQHQKDAATDGVYNFGAGGLKWKWAAALAAGNIALAAKLLRSTAVTAGGKRLTGLVRRRDDEARLMESGNYGNPAEIPAHSTSAADVKAFQADLQTLGIYPGPVDGKAESSRAAVVKFQQDNGLFVDGIVGPATRTAIRRALDARAAPKIVAAGAGTGAVAGGGGEIVNHAGPPSGAPDVTAFDWHPLLTALEVGLIVGALAFGAFFIWRNRGRLLGRRTAA